MSSGMSDDELIEELRNRFDKTKRALFDLTVVSAKLEEVNKKLSESERMKSNFLSNIRNEINNPLASILGLASEIVAASDSSAVPFARMIHSEAFDLDFQLRNIFMAAEIEAGETVVAPVMADIEHMIADVVDTISQSSRGLNKRIQVHVDPSGLIFKTDSEKLQCIINNLLNNSVEYTGEGGHIVIDARLVTDRLVLTVKDDGVGIDKDKQNQIFDRFRQIDEGVRKTHRGHGLGLSITRALVDAMGGSIHLFSQPGKGSTFTVTMPEAAGEVTDIFSEGGNEFIFDGEEEVF